MSAGTFHGNPTVTPKLGGRGWVCAKSQREIWLARESAANFYKARGGGTESANMGRSCERLWVIDHSFTGTRPNRGKGEAGRAGSNWPALPRRGQPWAVGSPCWPPNHYGEEALGGRGALKPPTPSFLGWWGMGGCGPARLNINITHG